MNVTCPSCGCAFLPLNAGVGADFQHRLPPSLTGGASLRDYFAAQALRSHYIISRTEGRTVRELVQLCYEIADEMMVSADFPPIPPPVPSPDTPLATPASSSPMPATPPSPTIGPLSG